MSYWLTFKDHPSRFASLRVREVRDSLNDRPRDHPIAMMVESRLRIVEGYTSCIYGNYRILFRPMAASKAAPSSNWARLGSDTSHVQYSTVHMPCDSSSTAAPQQLVRPWAVYLGMAARTANPHSSLRPLNGVVQPPGVTTNVDYP